MAKRMNSEEFGQFPTNAPESIPTEAEIIPSNDDSPSGERKNPMAAPNTKLSRDIYSDEKRMRDVQTYQLPEELDVRAAQYEDDDPQFVTHIRRAHKYHAHRHCHGMDPWKIEIRARDDMSDRYSRHLMTKRAGIPTPEDIREAGVVGSIRLMLTYYDPFKVTKGNGRGGWAVISSKPIEIIAPLAQVQRPGSPAQQIGGFNQGFAQRPAMPTPQDLSSVQAVFESINAMTLQAMDLQMKALLNRQSIIAEGVEMGKLQQQVTELQKQNSSLAQNAAMAQQQVSALASQVVQDGDQNSGGGIPPFVQDLINRFGPGIAKKFGIELPGDGDEEDDNEGAPQIPPQQTV